MKFTEEEKTERAKRCKAAGTLLEKVLSHYGIGKDKFLRCRKKEIMAVKHCFWFYLYNIKKLTYCQIADLSEMKGHNPVLRGVEKIKFYLNYDKSTKETYAKIKEIAG